MREDFILAWFGPFDNVDKLAADPTTQPHDLPPPTVKTDVLQLQ
jgi:hypothetical protein